MVHYTDHSVNCAQGVDAFHFVSLGGCEAHEKACFGERIEVPLPPLRPRPKCDFIHPRQFSPFPERLVLPFSIEIILSGYEELDSSGNDLFASWVKLSDHGFARHQEGNLLPLRT